MDAAIVVLENIIRHRDELHEDHIKASIAGAGEGKKPIIKIFNSLGQQLGSEFSAYQTFATPGIEVLIADVDFDGRDDIVGMSGGF